MVRYANFDPKSAYNYAAGRWSETQAQFEFPVDPRPLRDRLAKIAGDNIIQFREPGRPPKEAPPIVKPPEEDILVIDDATPTPAVGRPQPRPAPAPPRRPARPDDDILVIE